MKFLKGSLAAALLLSASSALALVQPMAINFQGKLVNPTTNAPVSGTAQLTFKIFNVASGGSALWTEGPDGVVVTNGVFALTIGTNTALTRDLFLGASAYLEITVNSVNGTADGTAMTPRQPLVMSPFAFTANQLSDQNDVRLIAGPLYSTFTSAGNFSVPNGITSSSATVTGGLTASSGTFLGSGASQFSIATSSGISVGGTGGVYATFFAGNGAALTGVVSTAGTSTGVVTTAALTGNGNSPTPLAVITSSVAVLNPAGYVQNFQLDPASVTKQGYLSMDNINSSGHGASITISTSMIVNSTMSVLGNAFSVGGSSFVVTAGSASVAFGLTASSATFLTTGSGVNFGLTVSSGILMNNGTLDINGEGGITNNYGLKTGTITVTGSNFTLGVSSFIVNGGSATVAYSFTAGSMLSASSATLTYGLAASSASFSARGSSLFYGLMVSSGIDMNSGTLSLVGTSGLDATGTGIAAATGTFTSSVTAQSFVASGPLTASSATLTATGSPANYGLTVSSGIDIGKGTLSLVGSSGLDATGTGIAAATATFTSTVTALAFVGEGSNITNMKIDIAMSSTSVSPALTANTEKIISYATGTYSNPTSKVFILANVMFAGALSATGSGRLYRSAAGGTCSTASTVVHTSRFAVAATANAGNSYTIFGLDNHAGTTGTFVYCFSLKSTAASTYTDHEIAIIDASAASTTSLGP
ncbi:MAG: beta strand repeat-containing protein [Elusimicrobiota bacterium]